MTNAFNFDSKQFDTAQLESLFFAPARAYAALSIDLTEKLVNAQLEASRAYTDTSLAQLRSLVEVKDAEGLKSYLEGQQQVAKELTERLKGDAEKVVALQQEFVQESQKLTESSVKQVQESAQQAAKTATESATESVAETAEAATETAAKSTSSRAAASRAKSAQA
ncbi:phasin family protein [Halomonas sp. SSL-5]|uniref:phasin family protein n=1 Tax=Halomonas sp. SSL-5 TaxID=3065855 RepID=UPI002AA2A9AE|nr:phasin family protein [Halomonas sp. SSL-5]MDY7116734.1 phasin family protein [Halomonas sp. SSL-5]